MISTRHGRFWERIETENAKRKVESVSHSLGEATIKTSALVNVALSAETNA